MSSLRAEPAAFFAGLPAQCMLRVLQAAGCLQLRSVVVQLPPSAPLEELDLASCRQGGPALAWAAPTKLYCSIAFSVWLNMLEGQAVQVVRRGPCAAVVRQRGRPLRQASSMAVTCCL